jgi:hypothetical protein
LSGFRKKFLENRTLLKHILHLKTAVSSDALDGGGLLVNRYSILACFPLKVKKLPGSKLSKVSFVKRKNDNKRHLILRIA